MSSTDTPVWEPAPVFTDWRNPLLDYNPTTITTWSQWMALWDLTSDAMARQNLLRIGLDMDCSGDWLDRLQFYFQVADGHLHALDLQCRTDTPRRGFSMQWPGEQQHNGLSDWQVRAKLAGQAFRTLAVKLFKDTSTEWEQRKTWMERTPEALPMLVGFLRPGKYGLYNLDERDSHAMVIMRDFAHWLVEMAFRKLPTVRWGWSNQPPVEFNRQLIALRPQLLHVLRAFKKLDILLDNQHEVDEATMAELEKMALSREGTFAGEKRQPRTLEEAISNCSYPALILHGIKSMRAGEQREAEFREAAMEAAEAQARLEELRAQEPTT